jgi:hypothetical protein
MQGSHGRDKRHATRLAQLCHRIAQQIEVIDGLHRHGPFGKVLTLFAPGLLSLQRAGFNAFATRQPCDERAAMSGPHRIVFANEKGGTGKSTTAVHIAVALAYLGARVGTIDLDRVSARCTAIWKIAAKRCAVAASNCPP